MVTIKDIALKADVSPSTVSRALKLDPRIPLETQKRILLIAKELSYKPNKFARNLVAKNLPDQTVGIVFPELIHRYFFELLQGIDKGFEDSCYNLMIFNVHKRRNDVFTRIYSESLAGLIIMGFTLTEDEKEKLAMCNIPYIYLDIKDDDANYIICDNFYGGTLVGNFFKDRGCKKLCYVGIDEITDVQDNRLGGFESVISEFGCEYIKYFIKKDESAAYEFTSDILLRDGDIDGIFYFCDDIAYGGINAVRKAGRDLAIVGYDDLYPSRFLPLTTVNQPGFQIGFEGAGVIIGIIEEHIKDKKQIIFKPELIIR